MPAHAVLVGGPALREVVLQSRFADDNFESEETFFLSTSHDKPSFLQQSEAVDGVEIIALGKQGVRQHGVSEFEKRCHFLHIHHVLFAKFFH